MLLGDVNRRRRQRRRNQATCCERCGLLYMQFIVSHDAFVYDDGRHQRHVQPMFFRFRSFRFVERLKTNIHGSTTDERETYLEHLNNSGMLECQALDALGLTRYCCRRMVLTHCLSLLLLILIPLIPLSKLSIEVAFFSVVFCMDSI